MYHIGGYVFWGTKQVSAYSVNSANAYFVAENGVLFNKIKTQLVACPGQKTGSYTIPESVTQLWPGVFNNCTRFSGYIDIPASLSIIGDYSFYNCSSIDGFTVNLSNKEYSAIDGILFNKAQDSLYICPLTKSGKYTVPSSVNYIGYSAFDGCSQLTEVILPATTKNIDDYAFEYCTGLIRIRLGENISEIGSAAFYNCSNLQRFEIKTTSPPDVDYYTFNSIDNLNCTLYVPVGCTANYAAKNYWKDFFIEESSFDDTAAPIVYTSDVKISGVKDHIVIEGIRRGQNIEIYNVPGRLLKKIQAENSLIELTLPTGTVYIVRAGDTRTKVLLTK